MTPHRKRVAILISGRGSNMRSLVEAARAPDYPAEIALVLSNVASAAGLDYARSQGVATATVEHKSFTDRESFERAIQLHTSYPGTLPNAWNNLGILSAREGNTTAAIGYFQRALQLDPAHAIAPCQKLV